MTIIEVDFYEDGASMTPEEVFYRLHPECLPWWKKIVLLVKRIWSRNG